MNFNITGHHIDVTDALKSYVSEKLNRVEGHFEKITSTNITLSVEKSQSKAEATLQLAGNTIHAHALNDDMYAAIDNLADKIDRQVREHKNKLTDHHKR